MFGLKDGESISYATMGIDMYFYGEYISTGAITTEGRVFTWGDNTYGQLGDGTVIEK